MAAFLKNKTLFILLITVINNILSIKSSAQNKVTFTKDIAPIVYQHCYACHRDGGAAPFPLESYDDVSKRGKFIQYVTEKRIMPPWKANAEYRHFADERVLSNEEINLIAAWVKNNCPEGKKKHKPEAPKIFAGSQLKQVPDLHVAMPEPLPIPGTNKATYACFKIPYEIANDTFVQGIEFIPELKNLIHHASFQILELPTGVDPKSLPNYFYYGDTLSVNDEHDYSLLNLVSPNGQFPKEVFHAGWLPGTSPLVFPNGVGFKLPKKGAILIRNLHISPTPISTKEKSSFNFYFSKSNSNREVQFAAYKPTRFKEIIQADSIIKNKIIIKINSDMSLLAINPHMHLLGRSFKVYALNPSKDTIRLVDIPIWDFNWQDFYRYKSPQKIAKGSVIVAEAVFDNTAKNPNNPNIPPKDILFESGSMEDTEEMMRLVFLYLTFENGDENLIFK